MKTNKIPDRWVDYSPMGSKVAGTRFIAFKTPLSKDICSKMKPADRFTPDILMERCPNMRLIIDLTNTDRYYNKQEFIAREIQYEKIMCPGHMIPPQSLIFRFFEIIDDFYLKNGLKDVLIGIHCTHGVNRTGYFIGRYMVQRMGFHYEKAISCIEEARGHKIERINYIKDLMVQVPIPSSLSCSSGKMVIDSKNDFRKGNNNVTNKMPPKLSRDRTPEKFFNKKSLGEYREPLNKPQHRRTPEPPYRSKEAPTAMRSGNFGPPSGRQFSPVRHGNSPVRRQISPVRRGFSPGRRPPSPGRRGGRGSSPKRIRSPLRGFSPRRRSPPVKRSPPRRMSPPPRREDFAPPPYRGGDEREFSKGSVSRRSFTPPRRPEPSSGFSSRGPPDGARGYNSSWQPPYDNRGGLSSSGPNASNYGSSSNQFLDSRPIDRHSWESRSNNHQNFSSVKPSHSSSGSHQWSAGPSGNFSAPPPNINAPPPNFESRSGTAPQSGRYNDRRFDDQMFPPPSRDEHGRQWIDNRPISGPSYSTGRFEEGRGFTERGSDYHRTRPDDKFEKSYRSPPKDYSREKRPPSPSRDYSRNYDTTSSGRIEPTWESRRRSPEPSFGDLNRVGPKRRSRSLGRRTSPPSRRSRSPRRRSPPSRSGFESRRTPPRNRTMEGLSSRSRFSDSSAFNPPFESTPRFIPDPPYQDKRFFESKDDCRDLLNQKRHFEGERAEFYGEAKTPKLDLRVIPKEVDLRKVIRGSISDPPLKDRLGPPPRDEAASSLDVSRRFGRGRSRSPRARSPRFGPPRRY